MKIIRLIHSVNDIVFPKITRDIKYLFIHCTSAPQNQSTQEMFNYWKKHNGWTTVGYHYDILPNGTIEQLQELDKPSNGVKGYNSNSIHVCYKGGIDSKGKPIDNRTEAQKQAQLLLIEFFKSKYPNIIVLGHRDISTDTNGNGIIESWEWIKSCPSYDVRNDLAKRGFKELIVPSGIIYKLNNPLIKNDTVREIQRSLKIKDDGFFGSNTDKAVKEFQAKNKLTVDGIVGKKTAELLKVKI